MKIDQILDEKQQLDEVPAGGLGQMAKKLGSKILNKVPGATAKSKAANIAAQADLGDTANNLHKEFNSYLGTQGKKMAQASGEDLNDFLRMKKHTTKATIPTGTLQKSQLNDILMVISKEALAGKGGTPDDTSKTDTTTQQSDTNNDGKDDKTGKPVDNSTNDANNDGKDDATGEPVKDEPAGDSGKKIEFVPNQPVLFKNKAGADTNATVVGKSMDGDDSKVAVKGSKGQKFNVPRDKLLDPETKKPFTPGQKPKTAANNNATTTGAEVPAELQKQIDALNPQQKKELASLL